MSHEEMPIFTRSFDFLTWLLPVTNNFPRAHRARAVAAFQAGELEEARLRASIQ
jgi:hypothetical protein